MNTLSTIRQHRRQIEHISARHGVVRLRVFGSVARGEVTGTSDVDLLVKLDEARDLLDLIAFSQEVGEVIQCKVDAVSEDGLNPYLRDRILGEAISL